MRLAVGGGICNDGAGSTPIIIEGVEGSQLLTLASGTSLGSLAEVLESFEDALGIDASSDIDNGEVVIRSADTGADAFVSVTQLQPAPPFTPIVCVPDTGEPCGYQGVDHGEDAVPGDVDCDDAVGLPDLLVVLDQWGTCPPKQLCPADLTRDGEINVFDLLKVLSEWTG